MPGTVTLKLRYDDFQTLTHAGAIRETDDDAEVMKAAYRLFKESYLRGRKVRLLGVTLSKLGKGDGETWLFTEMGSGKKDALFKSVDSIKRKFGFGKLGKASSLEPADRERREDGGPSSFEKPKTR